MRFSKKMAPIVTMQHVNIYSQLLFTNRLRMSQVRIQYENPHKFLIKKRQLRLDEWQRKLLVEG